jgi:hypothetical protein
MGRESMFTQQLAEEIVRRLSSGEPLADICRDDHMPTTRSVYRWCKLHPDFNTAFLEARDAGFDEIANDCLRIANTPVMGETETTKEWGTEVKRGDMFDHRKLQIETRLKLLAKWDPRRYGERIHQEHSGELTVASLAERMRRRGGGPQQPEQGVDDLV